MSKTKKHTPLAQFVLENSIGVPISNLAEGIGISQPYLSNILSGKKVPSVEVANKFARFFKVSDTKIYTLLGWTSNDMDEKALQSLNDMAKRDTSIFELVSVYTSIKSVKDKERALNIIKNFLDKEEK